MTIQYWMQRYTSLEKDLEIKLTKYCDKILNKDLEDFDFRMIASRESEIWFKCTDGTEHEVSLDEIFDV